MIYSLRPRIAPSPNLNLNKRLMFNVFKNLFFNKKHQFVNLQLRRLKRKVIKRSHFDVDNRKMKLNLFEALRSMDGKIIIILIY
jgi:hypothetical protein